MYLVEHSVDLLFGVYFCDHVMLLLKLKREKIHRNLAISMGKNVICISFL
jgi:hypothetical protein